MLSSRSDMVIPSYSVASKAQQATEVLSSEGLMYKKDDSSNNKTVTIVAKNDQMA